MNNDGRDVEMDDIDPVVARAIASLKGLPEHDEAKVLQIVAAARASNFDKNEREAQAGQTSDRLATSNSGPGEKAGAALRDAKFPRWLSSSLTSYRWRAIGFGMAAMFTFAVGYSTGMYRGGEVQSQYAYDEVSSRQIEAAETPASLASMENDGSLEGSSLTPVEFKIDARSAREVAVVGEFNSWSPSSTPLTRKDGSDEWTGVLLLAPGRHTYAFMIDGQIVPDPNAVNVIDPDYQVLVSTLLVKGYDVR